MPEYKLTIKDIIKGLSLLIITLLLIQFGLPYLMLGAGYIYCTIIDATSPLVGILLSVCILATLGILGGFGKAIEAGFSPYRFFDKFRNKREDTENKNK